MSISCHSTKILTGTSFFKSVLHIICVPFEILKLCLLLITKFDV